MHDSHEQVDLANAFDHDHDESFLDVAGWYTYTENVNIWSMFINPRPLSHKTQSPSKAFFGLLVSTSSEVSGFHFCFIRSFNQPNEIMGLAGQGGCSPIMPREELRPWRVWCRKESPPHHDNRIHRSCVF
jgi:hypothetical protein